VTACVLNGYTDRDVSVSVLGGTLRIRWDESDGRIYMTGPAQEVFSGVYRV
jgi:diaminopimelate epimerase